MRKLALRIGLTLASLLIAFLLAEGVYRLLRSEGGARYQMFFMDQDRNGFYPEPGRYTAEQEIAFFGRFMELVKAPMPRPNALQWQPDSTFYVCYTGPAQPYFDDQGCVRYDINSVGLRDRPDLTYEKPQGDYRILCLGDSFTLGWGVRRDHNWPVLTERELRQRWPQVRVVNCGGAGSSYADEYWFGLQHRFGRFDPDVVLVSLCLNDLIVTNGKLGHYRTTALRDANLPPEEASAWWRSSAILADVVRATQGSRALELDPEHDYVGELTSLPAGHPWYEPNKETPEMFWGGGTPQRSLRAIADWCAERGVKIGVAVWPLFQGLGEGEFYPFRSIHQQVAAFCEQEGIPFLDLLPAYQGQDVTKLWVSPVDMHPNETAQLLAYPVIAAFLADVAGFER